VPPGFIALRWIHPEMGDCLHFLSLLLSALTLESQPDWSGSVKLISSSLCADESHLQLKIAKCGFPS